MVNNPLFEECEGVLPNDDYDLMSIRTTNEVKQSDTQGVLQNFGTCNFLNKVENESFLFLVDNMHQSYVDDGFQIDSSLHGEHAGLYFHSEHDVEVNADLYMHYENKGVDFVLPSDLIQNANLIGETNTRDISYLPHESANENQIYDRGKKNC